jgi:hypothetical protein
MKSFMLFARKGNKVSFLLMVVFLLMRGWGYAQNGPPQLFARLTLLKATPGKEKEFENFVQGTIKPLQDLRRQSGEMAFWIFFKVHFTGQADAYNYVGVGYYPTWAHTEQEPLSELLSQSNPNADIIAFTTKQRELRTVVGESVFYQLEAVEPNPPVPSKYVRVDYMKVKPEKETEYLDIERKDWMPLHQRMMSEGQSSGWGLWQVVFPYGTGSPYNFATSSRYTTYDQVLQVDYDAMFKKVSPSKNVNDVFNRTTQSRELVKSELWEVLAMSN